MHNHSLDFWQHDHSFGQELKRPGESRTFIVIAITAIMMVVEIAAGIAYGSMALLADGLHMAAHAAALSISAMAYVYARRRAHDGRFNFGTGKVNALGGYTGAVLLGLFALIMAWESVWRLIYPVAIVFNQAIVVAFVGLVVNGVSAVILSQGQDHGHHHEAATGAEGHHHHHHDDDHHHHHDHNLRAAYLHVLADALTSVLAIIALVAGKYFGLVWMDPVVGVLGAVLVARWSAGLLHSTSSVMLDKQGPKPLRDAIARAIETHDDNRVVDLHVWSVGPQIYATIISVLTHDPKPVDHYKAMIPVSLGLVHITVEVHRCGECSATAESAAPGQD